MKKYKIWTAIMLSITLVMMVFCITIDVHATSVIPDDDNSAYYVGNHFDFNGWNNSDLLSQENYDVYYDSLSGYDKTDVINTMMGEFGEFTYDKEYATIIDDYTTTDGISFKNCYFKPIVINGDIIPFENCHVYMSLTLGDLFLVLTYQPIDDDPITWGTGYRAGFYSKSQFYISWNKFTGAEVDGHYEFTYDSGGQELSSDQTAYGFPADSYAYWDAFHNQYIGWFYFDNPLIFSANYLHPNYNEHGSPNYEDLATLGSAWINGTDTTGFVVDRRTMNFIDMINSSDGGTLGTLSGSFYHLFGGTSLSNSKLLTMYQLNDYADSNRYNVNINYDYTIDISGVYNGISLDYHTDYYSINGSYDSYLIGSSNFLAIDMNSVFEKMVINYASDAADQEIINDIANIRSTYDNSRPRYIPVNPIDVFDVLNNAGLSTYSTYDVSRTEVLREEYGNDLLNFSGQLVDDLRSWIFGKPYETQVSTSSGVRNTTTLCKLSITTFLSFGDEVSGTATYTYDFLTGTWSSQGSMDYDGDQTFTDYQYKNPNNDVNGYNNAIVPSDYYSTGGYITTTGGNGYGGNASIGNITIGAADTIVDISTDEWLQHSPNYNELITTIKTGLIGVGENSESVTALLTETYAVFPVPVWSYLTLAIATISALAVIRYIRRG